MTQSVADRAKNFVREQLDDPNKDKDAAMAILRKRCRGRHDPMSVAIRAELDRRERSNPLDGWEGWER